MRRFTFFPSSENWRSNPYLDLLQSALVDQGCVFVKPQSDYLTWRWLLEQRGQLDVIHLHWIQYQYGHSGRPWRDMSRLAGKVMLARLLGYRVVWTLHNFMPHESANRHVDWVARLCLAHLCQAVIVHCEEARRQVAVRFNRRAGVFVANLGTYEGVLGQLPGRDEARQGLGIAPEGQVVFLFFGGIRRYKGVGELAAAFMRLSDSEASLVIVGRPFEPELAELLSDWAQQDPRIHMQLEFLDDAMLGTYLAAADVVVLPFDQVLTSSSVMTALSAGRAVIAPALGCLPELISPQCGILYDPGDPDGLQRAMERAGSLDLAEMGEAARRRAAEHTWEEAARRTLEAYENH